MHNDIACMQIFSVLVATGGFLGFALVLALVEQAFLETLEGNVRVGSPVFECNHILLLAFGRSPRDKEMLLTVTGQVRHFPSRRALLSSWWLQFYPKQEPYE